jgi:CDK inhibitor PHO81
MHCRLCSDFAFELEVPSLIQGVRNAGLLVGVFGALEKSTCLVEEHNIDTFFRDGIVIYQECSMCDVI